MMSRITRFGDSSRAGLQALSPVRSRDYAVSLTLQIVPERSEKILLILDDEDGLPVELCVGRHAGTVTCSDTVCTSQVYNRVAGVPNCTPNGYDDELHQRSHRQTDPTEEKIV